MLKSHQWLEYVSGFKTKFIMIIRIKTIKGLETNDGYRALSEYYL